MIETLRSFVDAAGLLTGPDIGERYLNTRGHSQAGAPLCVVRPTSTAQVSAILKACHAAGQTVVAQGGMTGLVGGGAPRGGEVVLSLERMNQIEEFDPEGRTLTAQAGVILQTAHEYCEERGFMLPLDLGARGSATIGGVISTNAGGVRVIRYGMMRESVLGLEVVMADGTVISALNKMLKNNAGYDLKHMFIGSEGTLGIVTRAVCRLRANPKSVNTAFASLPTFEDTVAFLGYLESELGGALGSFEVMWGAYDAFVRATCPSLRPPLPAGQAFYVLLETLGTDPEADPERLQEILAAAMEKGLITDAAVAQSEQQRAAFWAVRENAGEGFRKLGPMFSYDVSMPIRAMGDFATRVKSGVDAAYSNATTLVLGHMGDGNLHVVAAVGIGGAEAHSKVNDIVYGVIRDLGGSISAEHGIGVEKKNYLAWSRTPEEIALMRTLKSTLDPKGILNPGKVL
ncbi:MAG: FAD-binding oxidoreductase [Rhodospirillaceae bacterium]|nr:FAD-binding oxidoreductase [Rhodospirillaceae bacterium]